jgi:hypothetical protein
MAADDRATGVDEGWDDGAAGSPPAEPRAEGQPATDPEAADKIDTAKSRVVRLVERPVRVDSDEAKPPSARGERTVPPPADYDVVRKTSKNRAFDLDAALQREAATKAPAIREPAAPTAPAPAALRGAEPTPAIPAPAPVPAALDLAVPEATSDAASDRPEDAPPEEEATEQEEAEDEGIADVPARGNGALLIGGATVLAVALVAGAFALRSTHEPEPAKTTVLPSTTAVVTNAPPSSSPASPPASPAVSIESAAPPTIAASAPAPVVTAAAATTHAPSAKASSSAPVASTSTAATAPPPSTPVASIAPMTSTAPVSPPPRPTATATATASAKGAPGIEFLKRDL